MRGNNQQIRLQRQTSVLHEIQENQEKEELATFCNDRANVLTNDSLTYLATHGRAEPVKLERESEKNVDIGKSKSESMNTDAARRQRVEELTRFFMEAKSDIEFALGGGLRESLKELKDKDTENEREEERENETGEDDEEDRGEEDIDPVREIARMHFRLLKDPVDPRVFNKMLSQMRTEDPALFGAVLCHPLITGVDTKKDKKKRKKRKDREKKEKIHLTSSMLSPDFNAEPLSGADTVTHVSRFVAKAIADSTLQGLMLAAKLVLSCLITTKGMVPEKMMFPLASHLRVLRGEKPPECVKMSKEKVEDPQIKSKKSLVRVLAGTSKEGDEDLRIGGIMDLDTETGGFSSLRARLSRFGEDEHVEDSEEIDHQFEEGERSQIEEDEGVDEDALMARAIALSLSPEITLRDHGHIEEIPSPVSSTLMDTSSDTAPKRVERPRPSMFSTEEIISLGPFWFEEKVKDVDGVTVVMLLIAHMNDVCEEYLKSAEKGVLPSKTRIHPHPLTFMLVNSLLSYISPAVVKKNNMEINISQNSHAKWLLCCSCSALTLFRVLEVSFFHVEVTNSAPASVGLGQIQQISVNKTVETQGSETGNVLVENLKKAISEHMNSEEWYGSSSAAFDDAIGIIIFTSEDISPKSVLDVANHYNKVVREQAVVAWCRGIPHFYPTQDDRRRLVVSKLKECIDYARQYGDAELDSTRSWSFFQLDLACARLALPDLSQHFVPPCVDVVSIGSHDNGDDVSVASNQNVDDVTLQTTVPKLGKNKTKWHPDLIRNSITSGILTSKSLHGFLVEHAPSGILEAHGVEPPSTPSSATPTAALETLAPDTLVSMYEAVYYHNRKLELEALQSINQLPELIDLLRETVLLSPWPKFSSKDHYTLLHAPMVPILQIRENSEFCATNGRILLLRSIQDHMVQRIGGSRGDEPPPLEFDSSRCAETMTLSDGNQTARQYTAKQWGMVMATTGCPPNTGIHEWAVRLDRCEKGHIFLGVCTRDASVSTYVGGDRQGWGLIGTRALWHNRSKVRGDYGEGFTTGSVVRVRLNTDTGALSFGIDDSDWGIAFDGLTQHGTLYPAIGLYQRDDQVSIISVAQSRNRIFAGSSIGSAFTLGTVNTNQLGVAVPAVLKPFLHHVAALLEVINGYLESLPSDGGFAHKEIFHHPLIRSLLTPLVSSLCLLKNFHGLASLLAMQLIPWCIKSMRSFEKVLHKIRNEGPLNFKSGLNLNVEGEWELKSMAAGNIPAQQYQLVLTEDSDGNVAGRSSGNSGTQATVTLKGIVRGTKVCFLETWRQGGTCLVEGRLRADGMAFHGTYQDTKSHTTGSIVGHRVKTLMKDYSSEEVLKEGINNLVILEMALSNLLGLLNHSLIQDHREDDLLIDSCNLTLPSVNEGEEVLSDNTVNLTGEGDMDATNTLTSKTSSECSSEEYHEWVNSRLLSGGLPLPIVQNHMNVVLNRLRQCTGLFETESKYPILYGAGALWLDFVLPKSALSNSSMTDVEPNTSSGSSDTFLLDLIGFKGESAAIDRWVSRHVGESPFARLGGEPMKVARRTVCAAMIWHSGFLNSIRKLAEKSSSQENVIESPETRPHENLMYIWRAAQRVIEWAIRAKNQMGSTYAVVAGLVIRKAQFLLEIEPSPKALVAASTVTMLSSTEPSSGSHSNHKSTAAMYECAERIYSEVLMQISRFLEAPVRISRLQALMLANCTKAFLRTVGYMSMRFLIGGPSKQTLNRSDSEACNDGNPTAHSLCMAIQWLTPSVIELTAYQSSITNSNNGVSELSSQKDLLSLSSPDTGTKISSNSSNTDEEPSYHYLSGIGGCGKHLKSDIRDAFESLYTHLSALLSKATWSRDTDLQLVILQSWGIIISPDDHAFLSRIGIFRILQTVLDEARGPADVDSRNALEFDVGSSPIILANGSKKVVQAALKVVHLLAAQVAHTGESDNLLNLSDAGSINSTTGSFGSVPLVRKPSGPETLGKSVFNMLYTELKNAFDELKCNDSAKNPTSFSAISNSSEPTDFETSSSIADGSSDTTEYCYQICSLLYSVSGSAVCRSHLSSPRWLRLLLSLVGLHYEAMHIRRRILKLLRRLLPSLDPHSIHVRYDGLDGFDADSDDDIIADDEVQSEADASTLIDFFIEIIGSISPRSVAEEMLKKHHNQIGTQLGSQRGDCTSVGSLAAEVVLLLRSLYESPKWTDFLNYAVVSALSKIPSRCVTENFRALTNADHCVADSDVEMVDTNLTELPSSDLWLIQTNTYMKALSGLCVLDGHIEGLQLGSTVKIMPRSGSSLQEVAFRGARGIIVAYEPDKPTAEVILCGLGDSNSQQGATSANSTILSTRPVRVPVEDLTTVPEIDLGAGVFSDELLNTLLVDKFHFFLDEIKKSLKQVMVEDYRKLDVQSKLPVSVSKIESDEEDEMMSNDGSSVAGTLDSEMISSDKVASDLELVSKGTSSRDSDHTREDNIDSDLPEKSKINKVEEVLGEMEKESRLHRMMLSQHGLRAAATIIKDSHSAAIFIRGIGASGLIDLFSVAISDTRICCGDLSDISILEESWAYLWSRWCSVQTSKLVKKKDAQSGANSSTGNAKSGEDIKPGPMVQQMMEMGFPEEWCEVALARCSNNVEAAINFCFEHSGDMERLLAQHKAARENAGNASKRDETEMMNPLLEQLAEMGFPLHWCKKALAANRNHVDAALTWILSNGEALEAEDRREEEAKARAKSAALKNTSNELLSRNLARNPLRTVSGQASIGEADMMVEGLAGGGFASVGAPDCIVSGGRWYYEATLHTNGCIQIGWADAAFSGAAERGDGVGDGAHSWAYDGWRQQKWHGLSSPWGAKWKQGDVVGCAIDADAGTIIFSLNGKMRSVNMGVAFRAVDFAGGLYPCASFNRRERLQFNLGGTPFKYPPPPGFEPILNVIPCNEMCNGFDVVGSREDALEEMVGEEYYPNDGRYFNKDGAHSSLLRGTTSISSRMGGGISLGNNNTAVPSLSRSNVISELMSLSDEQIYMELLLVSRSLGILQARRALLILLSRWPYEEVGSFNIKSFISASGCTNSDDCRRFIDFVKLVTGLGSCSGNMTNSSATFSLSDEDVSHLLDGGATGRYVFTLLSKVTQTALTESLSSPSDSLIEEALISITEEVRRASKRQFARIPWDASDAVISSAFAQLTAVITESNSKEKLPHPNLFFAEWLSGLLMECIDNYKSSLPSSKRYHIRQRLLESWATSLRSPSLSVKERGFVVISSILQEMLPGAQKEACSSENRLLVESALKILPVQRILELYKERLRREYPNHPICSTFLQNLTEIVSSISLLSNFIGATLEKDRNQDIQRKLSACRKLEADLHPLDLAEYDEFQAKKQEEAAAAAEKQTQEAAKKSDSNAVEESNQEADSVTNSESNIESNSAAMNMEIDNSDSEEPPNITLSAIANMVAEDSDVVAAAAAIAAAANNRLNVKRQSKNTGKQNVEQKQKEVKYEYILPLEEIQIDTSILSGKEMLLLEAAKMGIMGSEGDLNWMYGPEPGILRDTKTQLWSGSVNQFKLGNSSYEEKVPQLTIGSKVIRGPNWKWRDQDGGKGSIGTVEGISPWSGVDGEGMSVRWANDSLYTYRWGADGNYDLVHVELDEEGKITKHYPTPKSVLEDETSFGCEVHLGVLLHLFDMNTDEQTGNTPRKMKGLMEWPDYGCAVMIVGFKYPDGSLSLQELQMIRGNPDMGWSLRFGTEKWQPGTKYILRPSEVDALHGSVLSGEFVHSGFLKGKIVEVKGLIKISTRYLFTMDLLCHHSSLSIGDEGMSVTCNSGDSRNLALGTVGFSSGIHYWEVHIDQAEFGSVFIGVTEKPGPPGSQNAIANRLNRWNGWGFVNFRATYHNSTEKIYGDHFNAGDTIGVQLDMEQGKLSFFMDGIKYGEHIVTDLGVAFDNLKGDRNLKTLYPCIGMRKNGDRVSLNGKWVSMPGIHPRQILHDNVLVASSLHECYISSLCGQVVPRSDPNLPLNLLKDSWVEYRHWSENRWKRYHSRPRGVQIEFDTFPSSCINVCKNAGLSVPFIAGDRVKICSKGGRELDQPEEAVVLGVYREHLWYRTETQGNEGADEGRSWAWYWSRSELLELILIRRDGKDMTLIENSATDFSNTELFTDQCFKGRTTNESMALSNFETFVDLATKNHTISSDMQLVERLNTFCASIGVDVTNLKISDIVTPEEIAQQQLNTITSVGTRPRTQSFIPDEFYSTPALKFFAGPELRARCAILRTLNSKILRVLPATNIQPEETGNVIQVAKCEKIGQKNTWKHLSTSHKLRSLRRLIFTSTKRSFWDAVLRATTTITPLSSDEYEDPREIRIIRINRIQAQPSKLSLLAQPSDRLRRSVFGQLYREMRTWNDSYYRRAYVGKGHGGQKRAFKVKFLGEGVNDYGGPYRAVFEQVVDELQMDNVELTKGEQGLLPLLIPCPNRRGGTGSNQDKFLLNPSYGTSIMSSGPIALDLHRFLGKIIGTAVRHGLQMGLDLPSLIWRPLAGLDVTRAHLESVDVVAANNLSRLEEMNQDTSRDILEHLTFSTNLSDSTEVPLCPGGEQLPVTVENCKKYIDLVEQVRLTESAQQLAAVKEGLSSVLPMELSPLFTPRELEVLICGRREVDVDLLQQCTEYEEVDESQPHIQYFWEVLKEMTSEERTSFLRFVWARSRMPNSAKDFPMNFKIQAAQVQGARNEPDKFLPHAQTCFFSLSLPAYSTKEILRSKLLYAIQNSPNMDADVRLHNAEGWAEA